MKKFRHVLAAFYGSPWAILPSKLQEIEAVLARRIGSEEKKVQLELFIEKKVADPTAWDDDGAPRVPLAQSDNPGYSMYGNTAIIPIQGTITARPSIFEDYSGGASHARIGQATDAALADGKVEQILYDIDSPGGIVFGQPETGAKVFAAKKTKPTTAIANHVAASAAYWYFTQAQTTYVTPAGMVGCIGVIMANVDTTKFDETMGVRYDLVTNDSSPFKTEGYPQVPITAEAIADMKAQCNEYAAMFVSAVAKGRNVRPGTVERDFGKGRMLLAQPAIDAGMADKIGTREEVLNSLASPKGRAAKRAVAAQLAQYGMRTQG